MKMDRDLNADGKGKYALVKLRDMPPKGSERYYIAMSAMGALSDLGMLDYGQVGTESEFFVMRLKDKFSYRGLLGYMKAIELEPEPDYEYAKAILNMVGRAGLYSPFCKLPD